MMISVKPLYSLISRLNVDIERRINAFGEQSFAFGVFGVLNYPIFYLIWSYVYQQKYEHLSLRLIATFLCIPLIFKKRWPKKLLKWFPVYWYITLLYCLPFFFVLMVLKNNGASVWLMSSNTILFWFVLLVDWTSYVLMYIIGVSAAILLYSFTTPYPFVSITNWFGVISQYLTSFVLVTVFARFKAKYDAKKLEVLQIFGSGLAHELRTPLSSMQLLLHSLKKNFNKTVNKNNYTSESVTDAVDQLGSEVDKSIAFVDNMLINIKPYENIRELKICSINECIAETLNRYPLSKNQLNVIQWEKREDFKFIGNNDLIVHLLFNLIKNSLYYTEMKYDRESVIRISVVKSNIFNSVVFYDNGQGIKKDSLKHIFERFYSGRKYGTGIGLTFVKIVIESIGGSISCESEYSQYTKFTINFPHNLDDK